jgi:hypothetical protein
MEDPGPPAVHLLPMLQQAKSRPQTAAAVLHARAKNQRKPRIVPAEQDSPSAASAARAVDSLQLPKLSSMMNPPRAVHLVNPSVGIGYEYLMHRKNLSFLIKN